MTLCAGAGIVAGALLHPGVRRHRQMEAIVNDTTEKVHWRMTVGGALGAVSGAVLVLSAHWKIKKEDSQ